MARRGVAWRWTPPSLRLSPRPAVSVDKHCEKAKDRIRYQSRPLLLPVFPPPSFPYERGMNIHCPCLPSDVSGDQPRSSLSIDRCSPPAKDEHWIRNWIRFRPICCGGAPQVAATSRKMIVVLPRVDQSGGAISIQYNWEGGRKRSTHHSSHH